MNPERKEFLSLRYLPGKMSKEETSWFLGYSVEEVRHLTTIRLLKPLGNPSTGAIKVYGLPDLERRRRNSRWLHRAQEKVYSFRHHLNRNKKTPAKKRKRK